MPVPPAGLCDSCRHQRVVRNTRGSSFSLCERSREDDRYPRYPRLPVVRCRGHAPRGDEPVRDFAATQAPAREREPGT